MNIRPRAKRGFLATLSGSLAIALSMGMLSVVSSPEVYAFERPGEEDTRSCTNVIHVVVPNSSDESRTGDPSEPVGLLGDISRTSGEDAPEGVFSTIAVYYDASIGLDGQNYQVSVEEGTENGIRLMQNIMEGCSKSNMVVSGEGMGAEVAGNMLAAAGNGQDGLDADRVVGGLLFGDPRRAEGESMVSDSKGKPIDRPDGASKNISEISNASIPGGGLSSSREGGFGDLQSKTVSFCSPSDTLCASSPDQRTDMLSRFGDIVFSGVVAGAPGALTGSPEVAAAAIAGTIGTDAMHLLSDMTGLPRLNISPRTISMIVNLAVIAFQMATGLIPPTPGQIMAAVGDLGHLPGAISEIVSTVGQLPEFLASAPHVLPTLMKNLGLSTDENVIQDQVQMVEGGVEGADFSQVSGTYLPTSDQTMITDVAQGDINAMSELAVQPEMAKGAEVRSEYGEMTVNGDGETSMEWSSNFIRDLIKENA